MPLCLGGHVAALVHRERSGFSSKAQPTSERGFARSQPGGRRIHQRPGKWSTERRLLQPSGLEIEAFSPGAKTAPVDPGTRAVVHDGLRPMCDPSGLLAELAAACGASDRPRSEGESRFLCGQVAGPPNSPSPSLLPLTRGTLASGLCRLTFEALMGGSSPGDRASTEAPAYYPAGREVGK
jgi:hypothetical protein